MNQVCCILISVDVDVSLQSFVENSFLLEMFSYTHRERCVCPYLISCENSSTNDLIILFFGVLVFSNN